VCLPAEEYAEAWDVAIDTAAASADPVAHRAGTLMEVHGRSVVVLREHVAPSPQPDVTVAASVAAQVEPDRAARQRSG
jgi:glycogen operon protein